MVMGELVLETELLVIGSGPGGYAAAFRAADLGLDVTLIDSSSRPGGVCLFSGCIPSKSFLFLSELMHDAGRAKAMGLSFEAPCIDLQALWNWRDKVVDDMADGLVSLCKRRNIALIRGEARFENPRTVCLQDSEVRRVIFGDVIIATGSSPITFPDTRFRPGGRIMDSTGALALEDIPGDLLVIGGGYIGLELGSFYASLGSRVRLVESAGGLLTGIDHDLVEPLQRKLNTLFYSISLQTNVNGLYEDNDGVEVSLEQSGQTTTLRVDRVLVAIGRSPNSSGIGLENTGVEVDGRGYIVVDAQQRTTEKHIFAVGDVAGGMMLAHKASYEGKVAAEVVAGKSAAFDARAIPVVVYTDPQIAWCGLTEEQARRENRAVRVQKFPWKYSGRANIMGATDGFTKILVDPQNGRIVGMGVTGRDGEAVISEGVLAVEMGALAEDLALCVHPHPTLSETMGEAADLYFGNATHFMKRKN